MSAVVKLCFDHLSLVPCKPTSLDERTVHALQRVCSCTLFMANVHIDNCRQEVVKTRCNLWHSQLFTTVRVPVRVSFF